MQSWAVKFHMKCFYKIIFQPVKYLRIGHWLNAGDWIVPVDGLVVPVTCGTLDAGQLTAEGLQRQHHELLTDHLHLVQADPLRVTIIHKQNLHFILTFCDPGDLRSVPVVVTREEGHTRQARSRVSQGLYGWVGACVGVEGLDLVHQ